MTDIKIFGINPAGRTTIPDSKRAAGFAATQEPFQEFNQALFELSADRVIGNTTQLTNNLCTVRYQSSDQTLRDSGGSTVTFTSGEKVVIVGLDSLTANLDLSSYSRLRVNSDKSITLDNSSHNIVFGTETFFDIKVSNSSNVTYGAGSYGYINGLVVGDIAGLDPLGSNSFYVDSGVANAHVLTSLSGFNPPSSYSNGMRIAFIASVADTGATTVNVDSLGVKNLELQSGGALTSGIISAGSYVVGVYSSANDRFEIPNQFRSPRVTETHWSGTNGYGSTATRIRKFTNEHISSNNIVATIANDATNGFSVTLNMKAEVSISYTDVFNAADGFFGISKNASSLTINFSSLSAVQRLASDTTHAANTTGSAGFSGTGVINDVFRPHTDGGLDSVNAFQGIFYTKVKEIL